AYPPGSRIGLAPPAGMVTSKNFFGYEDPSNNAAIILLALPAQAYADLDKSVTADALKRQGVTLETREDVPLSIGKAFLVTGHQGGENHKTRKLILGAGPAAPDGVVPGAVPGPAETPQSEPAVPAAAPAPRHPESRPGRGTLRPAPLKGNRAPGFSVGRGGPG